MSDDKSKTLSLDTLSRRDLLIGGGAASAGLIIGGSLAGGLAEAAKKTPQVPHKVLGKTGKKIPILLFGTGFQLDPVFDARLAEAYRYGVTYLDTADCYAGGSSEPAVGSFLSKVKARKKFWVTSKSDAHDPVGFEKTVDASLKRLKCGWIDLMFMHALDDPDLLDKGIAKTAEKLKKQGKIRHFGFSCHGGEVVKLLDKAATLSWIDAIMFRFNFRQYGNSALNKAIDRCAKANIGLIAMKTQGSAASFKDKIDPFVKAGKWNKYQAVLKAVWADDRIAAAVSRMDTLDKVQQNVAAALDKHKLGTLELDALQRYAELTRGHACDGCDHLCGAAVDAPLRIGDTMRYLMYHDSYGDRDEARKLFAALPPQARRIAEVDFSAARAACPHGVDLVWHMRRASRVLGA